ncbi:glucan endo-1,3-beta-glucosidase 9-like [Canna indica]|uniref:glucan endo-1,3-beta-D-glucosidase n=1 Tax=Canna indica TaxID=4628 RepID=A0AAQ3K4U0_9LILI|nr:glucan endo-1,3-beta-glucosidase 9-like [Canna indica]
MVVNHRSVALLRRVLLLLLFSVAASPASWWQRGLGWWGAMAVGVHWGASSSSSHPLPPSLVVPWLLKANGVSRVKLPDADPSALASLAGSDIGVAIGIPNEMLRSLSSSKSAAASWVHDNVTRYLTGNGGGVRIEFVVIGDEPFLLSYGQTFQPFVVGAATNVQRALAAVNLANKMKVIVPCSSDVYQSESNLPSKGHFRPDLNRTMIELLSFLNKYRSPFVIDINPILSFQQNKNFSLDYFLFETNSHPLSDGPHKYKNYFDMSMDTLVSALSKVGYEDMDIVVGKIGWPTDGAMNATPAIAQSFMHGLINHLQSKAGSPLRPKRPPKETYIFSLLDEDQRSIKAGGYERHWGIFTFDGQAKYNLDLGQGSKVLANAHDVEYLAQKWCVVNNNKEMSNVSSNALEACSDADCSALSPGGSCSGIDWPGNVSYAFNSFFQLHDQSADSCDFGGLGLITTVDPTVGDCRYTITLRTSSSTSILEKQVSWWNVIRGLNLIVVFLLFVGC